MSHTVYGPSGWDWWSVCTAAPAAVSHKIRQSSVFSIQGTASHNLLAMSLELRVSPREFIGKKIYCEDDDIQGYWTVDAEMGEETDKSYEYVLDHLPPNARVFIEQKFDLSKTLPDQKGTGDVVAIAEDWSELHVFDHKYGKGVLVHCEDNGQMKLYGLGAVDNHIPMEHRGKLKKVVLHVLQPRKDNMSRWECSRGHIEAFRVLARERFDESNDPQRRKFVPGEKQCKFCPIRSTCRYLAQSQIELVFTDAEIEEMPSYRDPAEMTPQEQVKLWPHLDFIAAWANNMKLHMDEQARRGAVYPNLKLVEGRRGFREWNNEDEARYALAFEFGISDEDLYKKYLISPAVSEKLIGRKRLSQAFKALYTQKEGAPTLAPLDDARRTVTAALESEFDDVLEIPDADEFSDLGF